MAELVQGEKEHSVWFPDGSKFCYTELRRWTAHKGISLIFFLENVFKRKHFGVK